ncbi:MAG: MAPEG family protein [Boseongicola sp.]|nr:MAPEG family protein [Boseongicola sp.]
MRMLGGGVLGALWAFGVVWVGATQIDLPIFSLTPTLLVAFLGPGLVLAVMIFGSALQRLRLDTPTENARGSARDINTEVLRSTLEQTILALCLWPAIGFLAADDGPGLLVALGFTYPIVRFAHWLGYHFSLSLRSFGFSATFFATVFALIWAVGIWFT